MNGWAKDEWPGAEEFKARALRSPAEQMMAEMGTEHALTPETLQRVEHARWEGPRLTVSVVDEMATFEHKGDEVRLTPAAIEAVERVRIPWSSAEADILGDVLAYRAQAEADYARLNAKTWPRMRVPGSDADLIDRINASLRAAPWTA